MVIKHFPHGKLYIYILWGFPSSIARLPQQKNLLNGRFSPCFTLRSCLRRIICGNNLQYLSWCWLLKIKGVINAFIDTLYYIRVFHPWYDQRHAPWIHFISPFVAPFGNTSTPYWSDFGIFFSFNWSISAVWTYTLRHGHFLIEDTPIHLSVKNTKVWIFVN